MGHGNGEMSLLQNLAGSQKSNATDKIKATYRDNFSCLPEDISTKDVKKKKQQQQIKLGDGLEVKSTCCPSILGPEINSLAST